MPSYLSHLIEAPNAPVTREWAAGVEAFKRTVPGTVRADRKAELAAGYTHNPPAPKAPRPATASRVSAKGGAVVPTLAGWWREHRTNFPTLIGAIQFAARQYPEVSKADFVATLVDLGVNPSTAAIQFVKGRKGNTAREGEGG